MSTKIVEFCSTLLFIVKIDEVILSGKDKDR